MQDDPDLRISNLLSTLESLNPLRSLRGCPFFLGSIFAGPYSNSGPLHPA
jgi:hypothetical protein